MPVLEALVVEGHIEIDRYCNIFVRQAGMEREPIESLFLRHFYPHLRHLSRAELHQLFLEASFTQQKETIQARLAPLGAPFDLPFAIIFEPLESRHEPLQLEGKLSGYRSFVFDSAEFNGQLVSIFFWYFYPDEFTFDGDDIEECPERDAGLFRITFKSLTA